MPDEEYRKFIKQVWLTATHPFNVLWEWAKEPDEAERRAERWDALEGWAISHAKAEGRANDQASAKEWRNKARIYGNRAKANREQDHADVPGMDPGGWHPDAHKVGVVGGIGPLTHPVAGVLHSTETVGLPSYNGTNPHITFEPVHGVIYQHQSVLQGARALQNLSGGVETNRKAIQIEIISYAARAGTWTDDMYENLADLMRWVEAHCGVERKFALPLAPYPGSPQKFSYSNWNAYPGWCGHQNVPENDHGDPGALNTGKLVA